MKELQDQTFREVVRGIPKRLIGLVSKLIGIKTVVMALATWLMLHGVIADYVWLIVVVLFLFGREGLKWLEKLKR